MYGSVHNNIIMTSYKLVQVMNLTGLKLLKLILGLRYTDITLTVHMNYTTNCFVGQHMQLSHKNLTRCVALLFSKGWCVSALYCVEEQQLCAVGVPGWVCPSVGCGWSNRTTPPTRRQCLTHAV